MRSIILIFSLALSNLYAQDYYADMKLVLAGFRELKSFSIKAKVAVVEESSYSLDAFIKYSEFGSHVRTGHVEMYVSENCLIGIDHQDMTIKLEQGENFVEKSKNQNQLGIELIDEVVEGEAKVNYLGENGTLRKYEIIGAGGFSRMIIELNSATNFFNEIEVFYNDPSISVTSYRITYTEFLKDPKYSKTDFTGTAVVEKTADGWRLKEEFSKYELIIL